VGRVLHAMNVTIEDRKPTYGSGGRSAMTDDLPAAKRRRVRRVSEPGAARDAVSGVQAGTDHAGRDGGHGEGDGNGGGAGNGRRGAAAGGNGKGNATAPSERGAAPVSARETDLLKALDELAGAMSCAAGVRQFARQTVHRLREILDADRCDIWVVEGENLRLIASRVRGGFDETTENQIYPLKVFHTAQHVLHRGTPICLRGIDDERAGPGERRDLKDYGLGAMLTVPMPANGRVIGGLDVYADKAERLEVSSHFVATVARMVGALFEKTQLVERLERANRELGNANADLARANDRLAVLNRNLSEAYEDIGSANSELTRSNSDLRRLVDAGLEFSATLDLHEVIVASARRMCRVADAQRCDIFTLVGDELRSQACVSGDAIVSECSDETWPLADTHMCRSVVDRVEPRWVVDAQDDAGLSPSERSFFARHGQRSGMCMPLVAGGQVIGLVLLTDAEPREMQSRSLLHGLGQLAARAMANAAAHREAEALNQIARRVMSTISLPEIADACADELSSLLPFDRAALILNGADGMSVPYMRGIEETDAGEEFLSTMQPGFLDSLEKEKVLLLALPDQCPVALDHPWVRGLRSAAVVALEGSGTTVGALLLGSRRSSAFGWVDIRLLFRLGVQLSLAVNNALLFERVRKMHVANLKALSSALSAKDPYTLGHAVRVAAYVVLLGHELGWTPEILGRVPEVVYLHDIGKLAVSDRVLLKPTGLTGPEWNLMRRHSVFSAEIIHTLFEPRLVAGVRHHHERWDGSGYPDGLAGEDIPEVARALAVADAYDAMSSKRPYRNTATYSDCLQELERCRGSQFEPRVVDAFVRVLEGMRERRRQALVATEEVIRRIDADTHERLQSETDEAVPEYTEVSAILKAVREEHAPVYSIHTARLDGDGILRMVVDSVEDPKKRSRLGETLPLTDEVSELVAGREPMTNVLVVDESGAWVSASAVARGRDGEPLFLVTTLMPPSDAIELEGLRSDLAHTLVDLVHTATQGLDRAGIEAVPDTLTGLYNRHYVDERLEEEIARCRLHGGQMTVLVGNLDGFKTFNDLAGREAGDEVLREVAVATAGALRHQDVAARYDGDEFVVLLAQTGHKDALRVSERIRERVAALRTAARPTPTISIGLATYPHDGAGAEELVAFAERAVSRVKRRGGDGCR